MITKGRSPTDMIAQAQGVPAGPYRLPRCWSIGGPRRTSRTGVRLHRDERPRRDLHRRPPVVKESTGEEISKEDLGGPEGGAAQRVIHEFRRGRRGRTGRIQRYLSYFRQRVVLPADAGPSATPGPRATPELLDIIPRDNRRSYDMRTVLDAVFDDTDWLEVQPRFGPAIICRWRISAAIR